MAALPGDDTIYVAQRTGRIRIVRDRRLMRRPLLDISKEIDMRAAAGLLGIAFDPPGKHLYVSYADKRGDSRILEYEFSRGRLDLASRRTVLEVILPWLAHRGGNITFGPDGNLWFGLGDGSLLYGGVKTGGDPRDMAQSLDTLYGKLLRIDPQPRPASGYSIPKSNPFVGADEARPETYAYGLRNPWRFSFDRATGDLWIGDVGQYILEEIDLYRWRKQPGANFGWNRLEGTRPFTRKAPEETVLPIAQYNHDDGRCVVVGGYVYRGAEIRELRGAYLFGDFCDGRVRALVQRRGELAYDPVDLGLQLDGLISFGEDSEGELYVLSLDEGLHRLEESES
jgi:glucose/arabinose dehydrogenase